MDAIRDFSIILQQAKPTIAYMRTAISVMSFAKEPQKPRPLMASGEACDRTDRVLRSAVCPNQSRVELRSPAPLKPVTLSTNYSHYNRFWGHPDKTIKINRL
jgi:hypothetical protein